MGKCDDALQRGSFSKKLDLSLHWPTLLHKMDVMNQQQCQEDGRGQFHYLVFLSHQPRYKAKNSAIWNDLNSACTLL
jgi:hypothetical protein